LINEASRIAQGKESCERITIGVDPGEVFGLAVLADGILVETGNSFSLEETSERISGIVRNLRGSSVTSISVKIGNGVPSQERDLIRMLDAQLPTNVSLESVSEAGTNRSLNDEKHRRGLRDIASAIQIAGRRGREFQRRKTIEANS
jgi:predicted RNase H-like nuclease (RuvC/YqgF family)